MDSSSSCYLIGGLALHMVVASGCTDRYPDTSVFHSSGSGQLQANSHVASPWIFPGKPTRRTVTTMGSIDLVVVEDHMLEHVGRLARMSVSGYRGRRFEPRQRYVVSLSKTLYPHCFRRLSCEMSTRCGQPREECSVL